MESFSWSYPRAIDSKFLVSSLPGLLAALFILRWLVQSYRNHRNSYANGCLPPATYPHRDGIFGLHHALTLAKARKENRLPTAFSDMFNDVSPSTHTIGYYIFFKKSYWTRDPENIKAMLSANFADWGLPKARKATFLTCLGGGIFGVDGPEWEHSRAMLKPSFTRTQIGDTAALAKHGENLISRIPADQIVDLADLFPLLTMDVGTEMLFGESVGSLDPAQVKRATDFTTAFDYIVQTMSKHMGLPILTKLPDTKLRRCVKFVDDFAGEVVNRTIRAEQERTKVNLEDPDFRKKYIFPTELAKMGLPEKQIRIEVINIMVAGRDTTAALLSLVWWHLAKRPDIVSKLREELKPLGSKPPTGEQLRKLKYLKNVVNEVLRLHPINPLNSRTAIRDTLLPRGGGPDGKSPVFIQKGQQVMFSSAALQRREDLYQDALELKPERWDSMRPSAFEYIPFGGGPRICPGQQLALTEVSFFTARLLQEFKSVRSENKGHLQEAFAILVTSGDGVRVRFSRHED